MGRAGLTARRVASGLRRAGDAALAFTRDSLRQKVTAASAILAFETLCRLGWPLASWALAFLAVALLDLLPLLSTAWHGAILAGFAGGALWLAWPLRHFRWPAAGPARRRLESDSNMAHRPLDQWHDRPAPGTDATGLALWAAEMVRLKPLLARLRLGAPRPVLAAADPLGLRFVPLLFLAIAAAAIGPAIATIPVIAERLERALDFTRDGNAPPPLLQIWITPPAYTHLQPTLLGADSPRSALRIPAGSALLVELQGADGDAKLEIDKTRWPLTRLDSQSQRLETTLTAGHHLGLRVRGHLLAQWPMDVIIDEPPRVAYVSPPLDAGQGRLQVTIAATDDYGVEALALHLALTDGTGREADLPIPGGNGEKQVALDALLDLSAHPWSGLNVTATPVASDGAGQIGRGDPLSLTLPERTFRHPVAQKLVFLRHKLLQEPGQSANVAASLVDILTQPERFGGDAGPYLQITTARSRLLRDHGADAIPSAIEMLWTAAIRIEDGGLQDARDAVDQAADALSQALARGASDAELTKLTQDLDQAMHRLMMRLAQQSAGQPSSQSGPGRSMTPQELEAMLRQFSDLAHSGARDAARQSLDTLRRLLDQLSAGGGNQAAGRMAEGLQALQRLTEDQKALFDKTYRQGGPAAESLKAQQDLAEKLGQLRQSLPDPGFAPALGQAANAMDKAVQALSQKAAEPAHAAQGQALDRLQEAARQIGQALSEMAGGNGRDPLGRGLEPSDPSNKVKIPKQSDLGKAREILDQLRSRANDPERSAAERSYMRRLLDRVF